jgi:acyl-[acyl-carrier-protein]-phospholipid O-acyltransferase/long-chain-fatty-acid--[acyl-carrier-protein] ligase
MNWFFSRKFLPFFVAQFLGAYNDNLFKNILLMVMAYRLGSHASALTSLAAALFILPYFLFSAFAGRLADTYNRATLGRVYKGTELILMALAAVLLIHLEARLASATPHATTFTALLLLFSPVLAVLFLMGAQSAFWSPVKYAWLPQMLKRDELVSGNAVIEASTYAAIVIGTICGTLFSIRITIAVLLLCAAIGLLGACFMPSAKLHTVPAKKLTTFALLRYALRTRLLKEAIAGSTWFMMLGTLTLTQIFPLCSDVFKLPPLALTYFLLITTIGIGLGSFLCSRLMGERVRLHYLPIASTTISLALLGIATLAYSCDHTHSRVFILATLTILLLLFATSGGLFVVPLNTLLQTITPRTATARIIAGCNIVNSLGMVVLSLIASILAQHGVSVATLFLAIGLISCCVTGYLCLRQPGELPRFLARALLRLLFRVEVAGVEHFRHLPSRVVIIANHVSLLDGVLLAVFLPFRATFVIDKEWSEKIWVRPAAAFVDFLAVVAGSPRAVAATITAIRKGQRVVIFPEGRITTTGDLSPIQPGAAFIATQADAQLLPIRIEGAIDSRFSYMKGKRTLQLFPKIKLRVAPLQPPPAATLERAEQCRYIEALLRR